mmetsp:Transcript_30125/g.96227  ORF Transcript_30125/g.96227 Transcript_30125/m.96227 type:complete len:201 (+) Transcript_30125:998-1600(+)
MYAFHACSDCQAAVHARHTGRGEAARRGRSDRTHSTRSSGRADQSGVATEGCVVVVGLAAVVEEVAVVAAGAGIAAPAGEVAAARGVAVAEGASGVAAAAAVGVVEAVAVAVPERAVVGSGRGNCAEPAASLSGRGERASGERAGSGCGAALFWARLRRSAFFSCSVGSRRSRSANWLSAAASSRARWTEAASRACLFFQ